jgi:hypothetical protein
MRVLISGIHINNESLVEGILGEHGFAQCAYYTDLSIKEIGEAICGSLHENLRDWRELLFACKSLKVAGFIVVIEF